MITITWRIKDAETEELLKELKELYGESTYTKTLKRVMEEHKKILETMKGIEIQDTAIIVKGKDTLLEMSESIKSMKTEPEENE